MLYNTYNIRKAIILIFIKKLPIKTPIIIKDDTKIIKCLYRNFFFKYGNATDVATAITANKVFINPEVYALVS